MSATLKPAAAPARMTWAEYQEMDAASSGGFELVAGHAYPRDPGTADHCHITGSIDAELCRALKDSPYEPCAVGMKLRISQVGDDLGYYPDAMVLDDDPCDNDPHYRTSPRVLFEVLSPATRRTNRCEKLVAYRTIPSLQVYVIFEQCCQHALAYRRSNQWLPEVIEGGNGIIILDEIGVRLSFADIYTHTAVTPEPPTSPISALSTKH